MADGTRSHRITITVGDKLIDQWTEYDISSSMVEPADTFTMSRAWTKDAWKLCKLDSRVRIAIDGAVQLDGMIDKRTRDAAAGTMTIEGRCKVGRLVQTSIPTVTGVDGLTLVDAVKKIAAPWFTNVSLSDARNRAVRRGKGGRAPAQGEPAIFNVKGKLDEDHAGRVDPGEMCWNLIEQLASSVSLLVWSSADGRELIIGKPNYKQDVQYQLRHSRLKGSNVLNITTAESVRNRYALIETHGAGGGSDDDFGEGVLSHLGDAVDGPNDDGTGRDFIHPKRLVMSQRAVASSAEAKRAAGREMIRRDFERRQFVVQAMLHGQRFRGDIITLFAPNTLARLIDDDLEIDLICLIYAVRFKGSKAGETTELSLVPRGTEFVA